MFTSESTVRDAAADKAGEVIEDLEEADVYEELVAFLIGRGEPRGGVEYVEEDSTQSDSVADLATVTTSSAATSFTRL